MGVRFHKRIKLGKGITLNIGKKGASISAKVGNISANSRGRISANIPGTGITFFKDIFKKSKKTKRKKAKKG